MGYRATRGDHHHRVYPIAGVHGTGRKFIDTARWLRKRRGVSSYDVAGAVSDACPICVRFSSNSSSMKSAVRTGGQPLVVLSDLPARVLLFDLQQGFRVLTIKSRDEQTEETMNELLTRPLKEFLPLFSGGDLTDQARRTLTTYTPTEGEW